MGLSLLAVLLNKQGAKFSLYMKFITVQKTQSHLHHLAPQHGTEYGSADLLH